MEEKGEENLAGGARSRGKARWALNEGKIMAVRDHRQTPVVDTTTVQCE